MRNNKGQVSVEYMVLIAFIAIIIFISILVISKFSSKSMDVVFTDKLQDIGDTVVQNAREMYFLGLFSKVIITVTIPSGINNMSFLDIDSGLIHEYHTVFDYISGEGNPTKMYIPSEVPIITGYCTDGTGDFSECAPPNTCVYCTLEPTDFNAGPKNFELIHIFDSVSNKRKINISSVDL